nr:PREDICTED: mucin-2 [Latimeria chalumnae]|eukprot:XP_014353176.1 PREDICTED: mucin-2 [Latimeria chalumnae]
MSRVGISSDADSGPDPNPQLDLLKSTQKSQSKVSLTVFQDVLLTDILILTFVNFTAKSSEGKAPNHINSVCSTWGNHHYKTFDGDVYQFPGTCDYNFVSDCLNLNQELSVHVQRTYTKAHPKIHYVRVRIKDLDIFVTSTVAVVNEEIIKPPYYGFGVIIEKNNIYTKIYAKLGLMLVWNGEDAVMVELDSKYNNKTCGLCGDYNGVQLYSEFIAEGSLLSPIQYGNLKKVHKPDEECDDVLETASIPVCSQFRDDCVKLLTDSAFADCNSRLDTEIYIHACMQDMCSCNTTLDSFCLCSTISEYSRQCSHAGGRPKNWRTDDFCPKKCPFNMIYEESGSPCMDTCSHLDTSSLCVEHYMEGCFCPKGTVFDDLSNSGCIPVQQCKCSRQGKLYSPGDLIKTECEECICYNGKWVCKNLACPGSCSLEGGSHITTYDGKKFRFHGGCYYVLSKDCQEKSHTLLGEISPCSASETETCLKTIVLITNNKESTLIIKANGDILLNKAEIFLPYKTEKLNIYQPSSFHIIVETSFKLKIHVQLVPIMQVYIGLDTSFRGKTCGLCGNFNSAQNDDFTAASGMVQGTPAAFANSWKTQSSCQDRADWLEDPCSVSIENENYAEHWCSLLRASDGDFSKCHSVIDPQEYYKRCKYDTCNCDKSEDCMCAALYSYVRACATKGVMITGWRANVCNKYANSCPASQMFSYSLKGCQRTCRSLSAKEDSCPQNFLPMDGCTCPEGKYANEKGVCVPITKCPCYHKNSILKPGESIKEDGIPCICRNGQLRCRTGRTRQRCPSPMFYFNCNNAKYGTAGASCQRTCENLDVECYDVGCESGCVCPAGLVADGKGGCVKENDCPCAHSGVYHQPGSEIKLGCNTCTCKRGKWECTHKKCFGTCTIYGSGHYITFDEKRYDFEGVCGYIAVQDYCGNQINKGTFSIITENIPCGSTGTTCSKSITVLFGRKELKLSDGSVEISERSSGEHIQITTRHIGLFLTVESTIGINLIWDKKTTLYIKLSPKYQGQVCGLCGNYDGNTKNDFTTKTQSETTNPIEFGNSWKHLPTCPDVTIDPEPCSTNPRRKVWAELKCSIIKGETFQDCRNMVDSTPYFDSCVHDSCACDEGGDCECLCTTVASYAAACKDAGICVNWRTPEICPMYCDYYNEPGKCQWHYQPCGNPCFRTCFNHLGICNTSLPFLEGCFPECPPENPIFNEKTGKCVPEEACGCRDESGGHYETGDKVPTTENCASWYEKLTLRSIQALVILH